jgi:hypothetical protein
MISDGMCIYLRWQFNEHLMSVLDVLGARTGAKLRQPRASNGLSTAARRVTWDVAVACVGSRAQLGVRSRSTPGHVLRHSVVCVGEDTTRLDVVATELHATEGVVDGELGRGSRRSASGGWTATSGRRELGVEEGEANARTG